MPNSVLTKWRSLIARTTVLAVLASMLVIGAAPAGAAVDTSATCPSTIPAGGFTDLAGLDAKAQKAIDCLKFYGISAGTSATTFSPNTGVARWQMAIFLVREAEDHGITLPSGADQGFTDIATLDATAQKAINQIKQLGVTAGTSATTFSPNDIVPRWQMAIFLVRLADEAGVTLPSGAPQGFTDIASLSSAAQTAINQAKQLGITDGTSATTFGPTANVLRWQMALFIVANMAVDGVLPTGLGFIVTDPIAVGVITYFDGTTTKTVAYATTDTFTVDGVPATYATFVASVSAGDLVSWTGTTTKSFSLTNKTASGNLVNDVTATTFDLVDPTTGAVLINNRTFLLAADPDTTYKVDGVSVVEAQFLADLSVGDNVVITGAGTVASPFLFDLTNKEVTGTAVAVAGADGAKTFSIKTAAGATLGSPTQLTAVDPPADSLSVGGTAVLTDELFDAALSNGDAITYSKKNGKQTIGLVNGAPPAVTGRVLVFDTTANTISIDAGPAAAVDVPNYSAFASLVLNGATAVEADVDGALSVGDTVTYQADDPATTADESKLTLTSVANGSISGTPVAVTAGASLTLWFDANGPATAALSTIDGTVAEIGFAGNLTEQYVKVVNGTTTVIGTDAAALTAFETVVNAAIATSGSVTISDSGTVTVYTVTTP